jgi:hypothetical protein
MNGLQTAALAWPAESLGGELTVPTTYRSIRNLDRKLVCETFAWHFWFRLNDLGYL